MSLNVSTVMRKKILKLTRHLQEIWSAKARSVQKLIILVNLLVAPAIRMETDCLAKTLDWLLVLDGYMNLMKQTD